MTFKLICLVFSFEPTLRIFPRVLGDPEALSAFRAVWNDEGLFSSSTELLHQEKFKELVMRLWPIYSMKDAMAGVASLVNPGKGSNRHAAINKVLRSYVLSFNFMASKISIGKELCWIQMLLIRRSASAKLHLSACYNSKVKKSIIRSIKLYLLCKASSSCFCCKVQVQLP